MKRLCYPLAIVAAITFHSCGNSSQKSSADTDTVGSTADTSLTTDSDMQDAAPTDTVFASKAAISGMAEVQLGQLALEKTSNAKIKEFADMMVNDHGKANDELKTIAGTKGIALPNALDTEHANIKASLTEKKGAEFDKAYVQSMVDGHRKTLALMEEGSVSNSDSELKTFATKTAPVVKHHLEMILKIQQAL